MTSPRATLLMCLLLAFVSIASAESVRRSDKPDDPEVREQRRSLDAGIESYLEYQKRIESSQHVAYLDGELFGDSFSPYSGATEFRISDIELPGSDDLPVTVSRRLAVEIQPQPMADAYDARLGGVGNWDIEVPYMSASYAFPLGNALRCDGMYAPPLSPPYGFSYGEVWQGIQVHVPARDSLPVLGMQTAVPKPSTGMNYRLTTSQRDVFDCIAMQPGFSGQGFRMTTASGVRYYFDVETRRTAATLRTQVLDGDGIPTPVFLERRKLYLLASKIEDRFGNTVHFQYNAAGHPVRIWARDGRDIVLAYIGGRLSAATANGRTWTYSYTGNGDLSVVILPDASRWRYSYVNNLFPPAPGEGEPGMLPYCAGHPPQVDTVFHVIATHPSGAHGEFEFANRRHYRSGVHASECWQTASLPVPQYQLQVPYYFDVMSIQRKSISGPGIAQAMVWQYDYEPHMQALWGSRHEPPVYPCANCQQDKRVTIRQPDGSRKRLTFGMRYHDNDGRLLKTEILDQMDVILRSETSLYMSEGQASTQSFHGVYGTILGANVADPASARIRPVVMRTIEQDSVAFNWQASAFDNMARPVVITRSNTMGSWRSEEVSYHDNPSKWVLGQTARIRCIGSSAPISSACGVGGVASFERSHHAVYALPLTTTRFGKLEQVLDWDTASAISTGQRGTLATVADGRGNTTALSNWHRGVPRNIGFADGRSRSATVNDNGWVTSVTDENGYATGYGYDAMGRLASVVYPTGDAVQWHNTTQVFQQVNAVEHGIPAGHWRQTVSTGNARKVTYFDGLWRPLLVHEYDAANAAGTQRFQRYAYDHEGRVTFASYPSAASAPSTGVWTQYDPLGRVTSVGQDSEHGVLTTTTEYLSGLQTRITDPRGLQTTTGYVAYDEPSYDQLAWSVQPESKVTEITRDVFGKPTRLRQRNAAGTQVVDRHYVYDVHQQLCKSIEPETGATVMDYDAAGNLTWSASGLRGGNYPSTATCSRSEASGSGRNIGRAYDTRNRIVGLWTPDGRGNQSWQYTPDGLVSQSVVDNDGPATATVINAYSYNKRRLLVGESQSQPGWYTWALGYGYNANGHRVYTHYPDGFHSTRHVNALDQDILVDSAWGVLASNIAWHPNGAIKSFIYGNGIVHETQLNARQLPQRRRDAGITHTHTVYDANGNPQAIYDDQRGSAFSRWMHYDGLDRLAAAGSASFGGDHWHRFGYDALDNLTYWTLAGVKDHAQYVYDGNHRLTNIRNSAGANVIGLNYDVQGNLAHKNGQDYHFDYRNRLKEASGQEYYRYDAHGRRVLGWNPVSGSILALYGNDGHLMFQQDQRRSYNIPHVYLGGRMLARLEWSWHGAAGSGIHYQHTDALGSPTATTNAAGQLVERIDYEPFGAMIGKINDDKPRYTGHVMDSATGLTYMQQRYYDPTIGRFLSVDPITAYENPAGAFNRYWYANNNPYLFIDPDGRQSIRYGSNAVPVSEYSEGVLKDNMRRSGVESMLITSTYRDPSNQARVMHQNLERRGVAHQRRLYGRIGNQVVDAYVNAKNEGLDRSGVISRMTDSINEIMKDSPDSFKHSQDPSTLNTIDIAPSSLQGGSQSSLVRELTNDPRVSNVIPPPRDPAIHVEIPQKKDP